MYVFQNAPINRKQFWLGYVTAFVAYLAVAFVGGFICFLLGMEPKDIRALGLNWLPPLVFLAISLRLLHLRAFDIGYRHPGLRVMICLIPLIGCFQWLAIGVIPTGGKLPENYPS
jgi:hypothetical protein